MRPDEPDTDVNTTRVSCGNCGCSGPRESYVERDGVPLCEPCSHGEPCPHCNPETRLSAESRARMESDIEDAMDGLSELIEDELAALDEGKLEQLAQYLEDGRLAIGVGGVHLDRAWRELKDLSYAQDPIRVVIEPESTASTDHHYRIRFEPLALVDAETGEPMQGAERVGLDGVEYRPRSEVTRDD